MDIESVRDFCLALSGVTEDMPFGDDLITFRIEGKIFIGLSLIAEEPHFAVKLLPERNEDLRERYESIRPAWHWNKKHWSDVYYQNLPPKLVKEIITESRSLIISKLPKALKDKYLNT